MSRRRAKYIEESNFEEPVRRSLRLIEKETSKKEPPKPSKKRKPVREKSKREPKRKAAKKDTSKKSDKGANKEEVSKEEVPQEEASEAKGQEKEEALKEEVPQEGTSEAKAQEKEEQQDKKEQDEVQKEDIQAVKEATVVSQVPEAEIKEKEAGLEEDVLIEDEPQDGDEAEDTDKPHELKVNRAPVLTLWGALVASREGKDWDLSLSIGRALCSMFARSKGKRLGIFEPRETADEDEEYRKIREDAKPVQTFGLKILAKNTESGLRAVFGKTVIVDTEKVQDYLRRAFKERYEDVKQALQELANSHTREELDEKAYELYEAFRPEVPEGVKGWGRKGILNLDKISSLQKTVNLVPY